ncbi:hypothetical protein WJT86_06210 [Microvirga sp. W0021]|uniref:Uncharacterized protein n=1 Tax=Hohaiivirga grylli TaxID=3133970 RepID=A0ABV0BI49_9HYPH
MDRLKKAFLAAATLGIAGAIAFVALVFIGGALAIAGIIIAAMILVGAVMSMFGKKPFGRKGEPLTVMYTRVDETDYRSNGR